MASGSVKKITYVLNAFTATLGIVLLFFLIYRYGFTLTRAESHMLDSVLIVLGWGFVFQEAIRWVWAKSFFHHLKARWIGNGSALLLSLSLVASEFLEFLAPPTVDSEQIRNFVFIYLAVTQTIIFSIQFMRFFREAELLSRIELSPSKLMVVSFALPILIGGSLLKLPEATTKAISWVDAFFMATSALCVTGLAPLDPATVLTPFGQLILLCLIQIGGLGIVTLTMSFSLFFAGGLGVKERILFSELMAEERVGQVGTLLKRVTVSTLIIEAIGVFLLYTSRGFDFINFNLREFLISVFHSVSAFCNAGFALYTNNLYEDVVRHNVSYSLVICALIILGGLGYPVLDNLYYHIKSRFLRKRSSQTLVRVNTKLVLWTTFFLLVFGTVVLFYTEQNASVKNMHWLEQIRQTFFLSVTARTAGFNLLPVDQLSIASVVIMICLMWIGGSPMSTAGGIKTLTFAVAWLNLFAAFKGADSIRVFKREIDLQSLVKSYSIIFGSILVLGGATILLVIIEPGLNPIDLTFEAVSAFGTVGLSRGITGVLTDASKWIIIFLMFTGRIGFITFINSMFRKFNPPPYKVLKENIPIS